MTSAKEKIEIDLEYAKNLYKVLTNYHRMGLEMVSTEVKEIVSKEAYEKILEIYMKYHNANCGPFNRYLLSLINKKVGGEKK